MQGKRLHMVLYSNLCGGRTPGGSEHLPALTMVGQSICSVCCTKRKRKTSFQDSYSTVPRYSLNNCQGWLRRARFHTAPLSKA